MDKTEQTLVELRRLGRQIADAAERLEDLRIERDRLMRDARRRGVVFREIAEAAGVTLQRVEQVVYREER